jgi:hypothetical protein
MSTIFPIAEIEEIIISYTSVSDYKSLILLNKYYSQIMPVSLQHAKVMKYRETLYTDVSILNDILPQSKDNTNIIKRLTCYSTFLDLCWSRNSELAIVFQLRYGKKLHLDPTLENTMMVLVNNNKFDALKQLYNQANKHGISINIHVSWEHLFRNACRIGNLKMAQWIYSLDDKVDVHIAEEEAFRFASKKGHLDVAKWIYQIDGKTNIRALNDSAFKTSTKKSTIKVAKWLASICSNYKILKEYVWDDDDNEYRTEYNYEIL